MDLESLAVSNVPLTKISLIEVKIAVHEKHVNLSIL